MILSMHPLPKSTLSSQSRSSEFSLSLNPSFGRSHSAVMSSSISIINLKIVSIKFFKSSTFFFAIDGIRSITVTKNSMGSCLICGSAKSFLRTIGLNYWKISANCPWKNFGSISAISLNSTRESFKTTSSSFSTAAVTTWHIFGIKVTNFLVSFYSTVSK